MVDDLHAPHLDDQAVAGRRVLVVDDQDSVRELLGVILAAEGFDVVTVADGDQALAAAGGGHFDLVTIDLAMPGMTGMELSRRLKADPRTAGMAQMIVSAHPELALDGPRAVPVDAVLTKPFDLAEFSRVLRKLLPQRQPGPAARPRTPSPGPSTPLPVGLTARQRVVRHYREAHARGRTGAVGVGPLGHALETLVTMACSVTGFPTAMIALLDDTRQYPLAVVGVGLVPAEEGPSAPLCELVVAGEGAIVVEDVRTLGSRPGLAGIGTYVGVPLFGREGVVIGSLCVLDGVQRSVHTGVVPLLENIAQLAQDQLELLRREAELGVVHDSVLLEQLRVALVEEQLEAWFQPVVDLESRALHSVEALVRWRHPERGLLLPGAFLPLVEDSDVVIELDRYVLRHACREAVELRRNRPELSVAVNVSGAHVVQPDFADVVQQVLAETGLPPSGLVLELTESALISSDGATGIQLNRLRALGVRVYLDDFGTGWNALEQLLRLPADGIKVDRLFAVALGTAVGDALVRSVVGVASDLALDLVVEGLETDLQIDACTALGVRLGQGHRMGAAMPADELPGWVAGFEVGLATRARHRRWS